MTTIDILREAQSSILNKMIEALKDIREGNTEPRDIDYNYFKFQAARYEELDMRISGLLTAGGGGGGRCKGIGNMGHCLVEEE